MTVGLASSIDTIDGISTILTVDDDPRFRMQACDVLETEGVVVGQAVDGASRLEASDDQRRVAAVLAQLRWAG